MIRAAIALVFLASPAAALNISYTGDTEPMVVTTIDGRPAFQRVGEEQCYDKLAGPVECSIDIGERPRARPCQPLPACLVSERLLAEAAAWGLPAVIVSSSFDHRLIIGPTGSPRPTGGRGGGGTGGGSTGGSWSPPDVPELCEDKPTTPRTPEAPETPVVAAVPLPAGVWGMLAVLGMIGWRKRR